MGEVTHDQFVEVYYNLIVHKIPFTYKCRGVSRTFFGTQPKVILEVDWHNEKFWVSP